MSFTSTAVLLTFIRKNTLNLFTSKSHYVDMLNAKY